MIRTLTSPADVAAVLDGAAPLRPFSADAVALLAHVSRRLLSDVEARRHPDLQALGFWLRPAGLARLGETFAGREGGGRLLVPRGLAFHVPPANVGTLFAYGWALSLLAGNVNVVRLPGRGAAEQGVLLRVIGAALEETGTDVRQASRFVRYGHDDAISGALSVAADVRVIWGGDATVRHFRALPVNPRGVDVVFPDRFSWALLAADAVLAADEARLARLAEGLARDVFWFGQKACSSPRLLVWCGAPEDCARAAARLFPLVGAEGERLNAAAQDVGGHLARHLFLHQAALDLPVTAVETTGALAVLRLPPDVAAEALKGPHAGGGVVYDVRVPTLAAAQRLVGPRDQTLVHFGLQAAELEDFARAVNGRGLDRLVPAGEALAFDVVWDGVDLLAAFTKIVSVRGGE